MKTPRGVREATEIEIETGRGRDTARGGPTAARGKGSIEIVIVIAGIGEIETDTIEIERGGGTTMTRPRRRGKRGDERGVRGRRSEKLLGRATVVSTAIKPGEMIGTRIEKESESDDTVIVIARETGQGRVTDRIGAVRGMRKLGVYGK